VEDRRGAVLEFAQSLRGLINVPYEVVYLERKQSMLFNSKFVHLKRQARFVNSNACV
jgi:hypothetical protein